MPPRKTTKPATRKAQAKRANAPMKNTPSAKSPRAKAKAEASRAARTMAKTVKPGIRKSAAKKVEKKVLSAAAQKKMDTIKTLGDSLIYCIKQDMKASSKGAISAMRTEKMLKDMMEISIEAGEEMYR